MHKFIEKNKNKKIDINTIPAISMNIWNNFSDKLSMCIIYPKKKQHPCRQVPEGSSIVFARYASGKLSSIIGLDNAF